MIIVVEQRQRADAEHDDAVPVSRDEGAEVNQDPFTVPGFTFQMFTGYDIPDDLRALCSVRSREIYQAPDADYVNMKNSLAMVQKAPRKGSLAKKG